MDPQSLQYKKLTLAIGKSLTEEQLGDFKFLCKDVPGFTQYDMDEISEGRSLVTKLEQVDALSRQNVDFVANVLSCVNRNDLEAELRRYENAFLGRTSVGQVRGYVAQPMSAQFQQPNNGYHSGAYNAQNQPAAMGENLTEEIDIIVENVGRDWRQLARRLGLSEVDIECITENHMRNLREQSRQALWMWKTNNRQNATRVALIHALRKCRMNYIADIVEGYIKQ